MNINTNSWHYKFIAFGLRPYQIPETVCSYVAAFVMQGIATLFFFWGIVCALFFILAVMVVAPICSTLHVQIPFVFDSMATQNTCAIMAGVLYALGFGYWVWSKLKRFIRTSSMSSWPTTAERHINNVFDKASKFISIRLPFTVCNKITYINDLPEGKG